ncbi:MAG: serine--tRNA ligase, partial [Halobacteriota archaeon]
MLDRDVLREDPDRVRWAMEVKGIERVDLDELLELDVRWRELKAEGDDLRHRRNEISDRIGELKQTGDEAAAQEAIQSSKALKAELEAVEADADELEAQIHERELLVPNIPHDDAPVGEDETDNVERHRWGFDDRRELPEEVVPHYDLAEELEVIDFARGAKVAGGGFQFLKGDGARLEYALLQFMLDLH